MSETNDYMFRFGGISRLLGNEASKKISLSHAVVIGLGGVGSWAAESLVRSGIGEISLVDFDDICLSNTNRQLQALNHEVGKFKVDVLRERFSLIHPHLKIHSFLFPYDKENSEKIFNKKVDVVIDAIDRPEQKCLLISECKKKNIPIVITGGAGGRVNPFAIKKMDLTEVQQDRLLARVRRILRTKYDFPRSKNKKFNLITIASNEPPRFPHHLDDEKKNKRPLGPLDCRTGFGTASFVTGVFGFCTAATAIEILLQQGSKKESFS